MLVEAKAEKSGALRSRHAMRLAVDWWIPKGQAISVRVYARVRYASVINGSRLDATLAICSRLPAGRSFFGTSALTADEFSGCSANQQGGATMHKTQLGPAPVFAKVRVRRLDKNDCDSKKVPAETFLR